MRAPANPGLENTAALEKIKNILPHFLYVKFDLFTFSFLGANLWLIVYQQILLEYTPGYA